MDSLADIIKSIVIDAPTQYTKPSYEDWYKTVPKEKSNTDSYDLESAYKELPYSEMMQFATDPNKHLTDRYKKDNHITFSDQSKYHTPEKPGGTWDNIEGIDYFYASPTNVKNAGSSKKLQDYFDKYEKGVKLVLPKRK
jgi:hypothetical protein